MSCSKKTIACITSVAPQAHCIHPLPLLHDLFHFQLQAKWGKWGLGDRDGERGFSGLGLRVEKDCRLYTSKQKLWREHLFGLSHVQSYKYMLITQMMRWRTGRSFSRSYLHRAHLARTKFRQEQTRLHDCIFWQ